MLEMRARNAWIYEQRGKGRMFKSLAQEVGISPVRVQQIYTRMLYHITRTKRQIHGRAKYAQPTLLPGDALRGVWIEWDIHEC